MRKIAVVLALVVIAWFVVDRTMDGPAVAPAPRRSVAGKQPAAGAAVLQRDVPHRASRVRRNVFEYVSAPTQPVPPPMISAPAPVTVEQTAIELEPPAPQPPPLPQFTWRYLGRFGPDRLQLAAFARDGEVRNVQAGDRIDDAWVLRSIGIESIEAEHVATKVRLTIPMAGASASL